MKNPSLYAHSVNLIILAVLVLNMFNITFFLTGVLTFFAYALIYLGIAVSYTFFSDTIMRGLALTQIKTGKPTFSLSKHGNTVYDFIFLALFIATGQLVLAGFYVVHIVATLHGRAKLDEYVAEFVHSKGA